MKVGHTIFPCVVLVDVRDIREDYFKPGEKKALLEFFQKLALDRGCEVPPKMRTSLLVISSDLAHGTAAVGHYFDLAMNKVLSIKQPEEPADDDDRGSEEDGSAVDEEVAKWETIHVFSGGCKNQFKNIHLLLWWSMIHMLGFCMFGTWNFFCSCHGKMWADPEGGAVKHEATGINTRAVETGNPTPLRNAKDVFDALADPSTGFLRPTKSYYLKKGRGIHSRIPLHVSKTDVNRKIARGARLADNEKSSRMHQFMSTGVSQEILLKERSHYDCVA